MIKELADSHNIRENSIREDIVINLLAELLKLSETQTDENLRVVQNLLVGFTLKHNLDIKLIASYHENQLVLFCPKFEDNLAWKYLTDNL